MRRLSMPAAHHDAAADDRFGSRPPHVHRPGPMHCLLVPAAHHDAAAVDRFGHVTPHVRSDGEG